MKNFANNLKNAIMAQFAPADGVIGIEIKDISKSNDTLTGLIVNSGGDVSPVFYAENVFPEYQDRLENGMTSEEALERIASELVETYREAMVNAPGVNVKAQLLDYEQVKDKLIVCAANTNRNQEWLNEVPHETVGDISLYVRIIVSRDGNGLGTAKVNDQMLEHYDITREELLSQAWTSMKENNPALFRDMADTLLDMGMPEVLVEEARGNMYTLQTNDKIHGAAYGFNKDSLDAICSELEERTVFVLPSSINEVIIVPESKMDDPSRLSAMVCEVNDSSVPPEDFLSNNAYTYDSVTKELSIVKEDGSPEVIHTFENDEQHDIDEDIEL